MYSSIKMQTTSNIILVAYIILPFLFLWLSRAIRNKKVTSGRLLLLTIGPIYIYYVYFVLPSYNFDAKIINKNINGTQITINYDGIANKIKCVEHKNFDNEVSAMRYYNKTNIKNETNVIMKYNGECIEDENVNVSTQAINILSALHIGYIILAIFTLLIIINYCSVVIKIFFTRSEYTYIPQ